MFLAETPVLLLISPICWFKSNTQLLLVGAPLFGEYTNSVAEMLGLWRIYPGLLMVFSVALGHPHPASAKSP